MGFADFDTIGNFCLHWGVKVFLHQEIAKAKGKSKSLDPPHPSIFSKVSHAVFLGVNKP